MSSRSIHNESEPSDGHHNQPGNLYAALARTATRSITLYFSRPVRLFRPTKGADKSTEMANTMYLSGFITVSGWQSLRSLASQQGATLSPQYLSSLVKNHGFMVIPKHFVPPILVNALLGTVLWTTYTETSGILKPYFESRPTVLAMFSGAVSGGAQALVAAPAENVRLVLEGGTSGHSWSHAWKEVFRGTSPPPFASKKQNIEDIRQVRNWLKDVGDMAGRGWSGWGWGCAKDMCGFAAFFAIFDVTRRIASSAKSSSKELAWKSSGDGNKHGSSWIHVPQTVHAIILVTGGVLAGLAYEMVGRPWDIARRTVKLAKMTQPSGIRPAFAIFGKFRQDGILSFFRDDNATHYEHMSATHHKYKRLHAVLRTLGRVGPWGVGFLVWEVYGPAHTATSVS